MTTRNVASPRLERLQWQFGEVEGVVAKLWAIWIGWWCGVDGVRAWQRRATMVTAARLGSGVSERERREGERVSA